MRCHDIYSLLGSSKVAYRHVSSICLLVLIYLAYSMTALHHEALLAFEDTWIECIGDLGHFRMAIEDDSISDRKVWTDIAEFM